jgi:hypothetical protein
MTHTYESARELATLRASLRALRAEMRAAGVRKTSPFNGGLDRDTYYLNARRFALETRIAASRA